MRAPVAAIAILFVLAASTARAETAISVGVGTRCFDVRAADGGCLVSQQVAIVWRYGEIHGAFLANDFPGGALVIGASFGGDIGTPLYRLAHDRLRLGARLTVDGGIIDREPRSRDHLDFDAVTFTAGPQLWIRLSAVGFLFARAAFGGSVYIFDAFPAGNLRVAPTVDAAIGFAFPLDAPAPPPPHPSEKRD